MCLVELAAPVRAIAGDWEGKGSLSSDYYGSRAGHLQRHGNYDADYYDADGWDLDLVDHSAVLIL